MAQRPEFPGDPSLLIRINEGNAEMCTGWLRESKRDDDVEVPSVWIDNYIKRRCPKDTSSETKERLWKEVRVVLCCVVFECCVRVLCSSVVFELCSSCVRVVFELCSSHTQTQDKIVFEHNNNNNNI